MDRNLSSSRQGAARVKPVIINPQSSDEESETCDDPQEPEVVTENQGPQQMLKTAVAKDDQLKLNWEYTEDEIWITDEDSEELATETEGKGSSQGRTTGAETTDSQEDTMTEPGEENTAPGTEGSGSRGHRRPPLIGRRREGTVQPSVEADGSKLVDPTFHGKRPRTQREKASSEERSSLQPSVSEAGDEGWAESAALGDDQKAQMSKELPYQEEHDLLQVAANTAQGMLNPLAAEFKPVSAQSMSTAALNYEPASTTTSPTQGVPESGCAVTQPTPFKPATADSVDTVPMQQSDRNFTSRRKRYTKYVPYFEKNIYKYFPYPNRLLAEPILHQQMIRFNAGRTSRFMWSSERPLESGSTWHSSEDSCRKMADENWRKQERSADQPADKVMSVKVSGDDPGRQRIDGDTSDDEERGKHQTHTIGQKMDGRGEDSDSAQHQTKLKQTIAPANQEGGKTESQESLMAGVAAATAPESTNGQRIIAQNMQDNRTDVGESLPGSERLCENGALDQANFSLHQQIGDGKCTQSDDDMADKVSVRNVQDKNGKEHDQYETPMPAKDKRDCGMNQKEKGTYMDDSFKTIYPSGFQQPEDIPESLAESATYFNIGSMDIGNLVSVLKSSTDSYHLTYRNGSMVYDLVICGMDVEYLSHSLNKLNGKQNRSCTIRQPQTADRAGNKARNNNMRPRSRGRQGKKRPQERQHRTDVKQPSDQAKPMTQEGRGRETRGKSASTGDGQHSAADGSVHTVNKHNQGNWKKQKKRGDTQKSNDIPNQNHGKGKSVNSKKQLDNQQQSKVGDRQHEGAEKPVGPDCKKLDQENSKVMDNQSNTWKPVDTGDKHNDVRKSPTFTRGNEQMKADYTENKEHTDEYKPDNTDEGKSAQSCQASTENKYHLTSENQGETKDGTRKNRVHTHYRTSVNQADTNNSTGDNHVYIDHRTCENQVYIDQCTNENQVYIDHRTGENQVYIDHCTGENQVYIARCTGENRDCTDHSTSENPVFTTSEQCHGTAPHGEVNEHDSRKSADVQHHQHVEEKTTRVGDRLHDDLEKPALSGDKTIHDSGTPVSTDKKDNEPNETESTVYTGDNKRSNTEVPIHLNIKDDENEKSSVQIKPEENDNSDTDDREVPSKSPVIQPPVQDNTDRVGKRGKNRGARAGVRGAIARRVQKNPVATGSRSRGQGKPVPRECLEGTKNLHRQSTGSKPVQQQRAPANQPSKKKKKRRKNKSSNNHKAGSASDRPEQAAADTDESRKRSVNRTGKGKKRIPPRGSSQNGEGSADQNQTSGPVPKPNTTLAEQQGSAPPEASRADRQGPKPGTSLNKWLDDALGFDGAHLLSDSLLQNIRGHFENVLERALARQKDSDDAEWA